MFAFAVVRQLWQNLRRDTFSTVVAVCVMAMGIGSVTAMFSVINAVLLRPLPFADNAHLFELRAFSDTGGSGIASGDFEALRTASGIVQSTLISTGAVTLTGREGAENVFSEKLAGDGLEIYGVLPELGHLPEIADEHSVVISHRLWQRRFAGAADVVGRTINVNGEACTISAVMPAAFSAGNRADLWTFWRFGEQERKAHGGATSTFLLRLGPGATPDAIEPLISAIAQRHQPVYSKLRLEMKPLSARIIGNSGPVLWTLAGAVTMVLLVACMNAGSLLVVRGLARRRETAVRAALGAGKWRLISPVLNEAASISLAAAVVGSAMAWAIVSGLKQLLAGSVSQPLPRLDQASIDARALAVCIMASVVCIFLASVGPALAAMRVSPAAAFGDGGRSASAGRFTIRFGVATTVLQTALSVILLAAAGLLLRSLVQLIEQDPGYQREGVLTARIPMPFDVRQRFGKAAEYEHYCRVLEAVRTMPGVESAAVTTVLPLGRVAASVDFVPEGQPEPKQPYVQAYGITPDYFRVMEIPLRAGRWFGERDTLEAAPVVVINDVTARRFWPGENPVGKRVKGNIPMVVVGVVGGVRRGSMRDAPKEEIYRPLPQFLFALHGSTLVLRTSPGVSPNSLAAPLCDLLTRQFPSYPVAEVRPMTSWIQESVTMPRVYAVLLGGFALQALIIASAELFGLLAHSTAVRRRELGIRIAIGARPSQVGLMLLRQGLTVVLVGTVLGALGAVLLVDVLRTQLYQVQPADPANLVAVALLFAAVATLAMFIPALRATRTDPAQVLRAE